MFSLWRICTFQSVLTGRDARSGGEHIIPYGLTITLCDGQGTHDIAVLAGWTIGLLTLVFFELFSCDFDRANVLD